MMSFALLVLVLLTMIVPVAMIGALSLELRGVNSIDLSVKDFYIVVGTTHLLIILGVIEVAAVTAAAYVLGHTHIGQLMGAGFTSTLYK